MNNITFIDKILKPNERVVGSYVGLTAGHVFLGNEFENIRKRRSIHFRPADIIEPQCD